TDLAGDKVVLMLGRNQDLDIPGLLSLIDRNLDGHQSTEILEQLLGFVMQVMLLLGIQSTVPSRDLDLHSSTPSLTLCQPRRQRAMATPKFNPFPCIWSRLHRGKDHPGSFFQNLLVPVQISNPR